MKLVLFLGLLSFCMGVSLRNKALTGAKTMVMTTQHWPTDECPNPIAGYYLDSSLKAGCKNMNHFICLACTVCDDQNYQLVDCLKMADRVCKGWADAIAGQMRTGGSATEDARVTDCDPGTHSKTANAPSCDTCEAGTYSGAKSSSCTPCASGTFSEAGAAECLEIIDLLSAGKPTSQSTTGWSAPASRAVDGNTNTVWGGNSCTHTNQGDSWWTVNLEALKKIDKVDIWNRSNCCSDRLNELNVGVNMEAGAPYTTAEFLCTRPSMQSGKNTFQCENKVGQYVSAMVNNEYLTLCEVQVHGRALTVAEQTTAAAALAAMVGVASGKPTSQSTTGWSAPASRAVDGNTNTVWGGNSCTHTNQGDSWWQVNLNHFYKVENVKIWNRSNCCSDRLNAVTVGVRADNTKLYDDASLLCTRPTMNSGENLFACGNKVGQFVTVAVVNEYLTLCEVKVFGEVSTEAEQSAAIAAHAALPVLLSIPAEKTSQSTTGWSAPASRAVDGNTNTVWNGNSCTHTNKGANWWQADLDSSQAVDKVEIWNRSDCCSDRLGGARVTVRSDDSKSNTATNACTGPGTTVVGAGGKSTFSCDNKQGRYVTIMIENDYLTLCEVKVWK